MKYSARVVDAFLALVRAGLWEQPVSLPALEESDWESIMTLSEEQTVVGLVGDGLSRASGSKPPKTVRNYFISTVYATEQRNAQMDAFMAAQYAQLQVAGINAIVLKGQGVARCYSHPQWRQSGDIDYLLYGESYPRAKAVLVPLADEIRGEDEGLLHLPLRFGDVEVELHGTLNTDISRRIDSYLSEMQRDLFMNKEFRPLQLKGVEIHLPSFQFDAVYIFSHILHHFYQGGIGLRQVCDWVRVLHVSHSQLDIIRLETDLKAMHLIHEWQVFGSFAVKYLGMAPAELPLYAPASDRQIGRLLRQILVSGNFGHNYEVRNLDFKNYIHRKVSAFVGRSNEILRAFFVFPGKTLANLFSFLWNGLKKVFRWK